MTNEAQTGTPAPGQPAPATAGNVMKAITVTAASASQIGIAAYFGIEVTGAAFAVVGLVEVLKAKLPALPSTLALLVLSAGGAIGLAGLEHEAVAKGMQVLAAASIGYAGILARFKAGTE